MAEKIRTQLMLPEALITCGTFGDGVTPAVPEEQDTFFSAQLPGSLAVEVDHTTAANLNGIVGPDQLQASRTSRLSHKRQYTVAGQIQLARYHKPLTPRLHQPR